MSARSEVLWRILRQPYGSSGPRSFLIFFFSLTFFFFFFFSIFFYINIFYIFFHFFLHFFFFNFFFIFFYFFYYYFFIFLINIFFYQIFLMAVLGHHTIPHQTCVYPLPPPFANPIPKPPIQDRVRVFRTSI